VKRWGPLAFVAGVGLLLALTVPLWPELSHSLPPCPFRTLTGVPCPTCGTTRAVLALSHGHVGEAFLHNPMVTVGLFFTGLAAVLWAVAHAGGKSLPKALASLDRHWPWWLRVGVTLALVANWAWVVARG